MWDKLILGYVLTFILRQLAKFGDALSWDKVKADWEPRLRALVPGTWFDNEVVAAVHALVDACSVALKDAADLQTVLAKLAAQDWAGAYAALVVLVDKAFHPTDVKGLALKAHLSDLAKAA